MAPLPDPLPQGEREITIELCEYCVSARDDRYCRAANHLVHPVDNTPMLFDVNSEAACPLCGSLWRRTTDNVTRLVG